MNSRQTYSRLSRLPRPDTAKVTESLRVGLLVPPSNYVVPCGWEWVHTAPFEGPSIIASLLKGRGFALSFFDQRDVPDADAFIRDLPALDILGICTYEDNFPYVQAVIRKVKKKYPHMTIVLGGPLVSSAPKLLMENTLADYAVVGEGELTLMELLDVLTKNTYAKPIREIDGLAWKRKNGSVVLNEPRMQMKDLDAVPFQDFSVWKRFAGKPIPEIYLSYSRGCVGNCAFCYRPMPKLSYKSVRRVRDEIKYLKQYGFRMVWWNDLTFVTDKSYVRRLIRSIFKVHTFRWCCFARVNMIDLPILKLMQRHGCDLILYGFESISQDILNAYRKGTTQHAIVNAIQLTRKAGIKCGGLLIVGAPGETRESIDRLISFCREFKEVTRVKYLSALPGTPLYQWAIKQGLIKDEIAHLTWLSKEESIEDDIDKKGFLFFSKQLSKEDLRRAYREVNGVIEERPYDYTKPTNVYLTTPKKFTRRAVH